MGEDQPQPPFYFERDGTVYVPSKYTLSPWNSSAIAGGSTAPLLGAIIDGAGFDPGFEPCRFTLDILGVVPAVPLESRLTALRLGRQMQLHRVELLADGVVVAQAHLVLARHLETPQFMPASTYPAPDAVAEQPFPGSRRIGGVVQIRPVLGGAQIPGRGVVWLALRGQVIRGVSPGPFVKACLFSDFGNGMGSVTRAEEWSFANLDITLNFLRRPQGDWFLIDAETEMAGNGHGLARSTFADIHGIYAHGTQTVFIAPGRGNSPAADA